MAKRRIHFSTTEAPLTALACNIERKEEPAGHDGICSTELKVVAGITAWKVAILFNEYLETGHVRSLPISKLGTLYLFLNLEFPKEGGNSTRKLQGNFLNTSCFQGSGKNRAQPSFCIF